EADLLLDFLDLVLRLLDADDELLELLDDLLDLLLVDAELGELLEHLLLVLFDLFLELLLLGLGKLAGDLLVAQLVLAVQAAHLVDELDDAVGVPLLVELGVFLVDVADDLLDADLGLLELVAELEDLLDGDRRVEHDLQHAPLAFLDALGDLDLAFAREQRDRAHLAQVHAHRVVGLRIALVVLFGLFLLALFFVAVGGSLFRLLAVAERGGLGDGLGRRARGRDLDPAAGAGAVDDLDAFVAERRKPVVDLIGGHDFVGHGVVDLVVGHVALLLAHRDELLLGTLGVAITVHRELLLTALIRAFNFWVSSKSPRSIAWDRSFMSDGRSDGRRIAVTIAAKARSGSSPAPANSSDESALATASRISAGQALSSHGASKVRPSCAEATNV